MISSLHGSLRVREPTRVVLEVSGIGFELTVPLSTSRALPEPGGQLRLLVQTVFSRTGMMLFGFLTQEERTTFNSLIGIRGIGPKAALHLLSRFSPTEISAILTEQKLETLKSVPGIGPRKAELILGRIAQTSPPADSEVLLEPAITALVSLGLTRAEALRRLERIPERTTLSLSELLSRALRLSETS